MSKRSYRQYCSIAHALDIVGERWTLLMIRELLIGPKRFTDILNNLPGIGTNLLTSRLKDLEGEEVIRRRWLPPPAGSTVYELTEKGRGLETVIIELGKWGSLGQALPRTGDHFRPGWSVLAMHFAFRAEVAAGLTEKYEFRIGDEIFHASVENGEIETGQGPIDAPDLVITADAYTYSAVAMQRVTLMEAIDAGNARYQGDEDALKHCSEVFGLPV